MKRNKLLLILFVLLAFAGNAIAQFGPIGYDFKDPYVEFDNLRFAVRLSTVNNIYCPDPNSLQIEKTSADELTLSSDDTDNFPQAVTLPQPASVYLDPHGRLGERFYGNIKYIRYLHEEYGEEMLEAYATRHYVPGGFMERVWDREYGGKWLDAAIRTAANTGDDKLMAMVDDFAAALLTHQQTDGYMGIKLPTNRQLVLWEKHWDLWNQWYAMTGFLSYYEFRGDSHFLEAASRVATWILENYGTIENDSARFLIEGDINGGSNVAGIVQLMRLYRYTGNEKLIEFVGKVLDHYAPIQRMINTGIPELTHPYMLCAYLTGMAEYAHVKGDYQTLAWVERIWERMLSDYLYPTGSLGEGEKLHPGDLKDVQDASIQETCATTEWIFFTQSLYMITGRAKYVEALENTIFNALLAAQSEDCMKWCYYTPLHNHKDWFSGPTKCCYWSGPRGIARFPQLIYAQREDIIYINFFETSRAALTTPGGKVQITQDSEFPEIGRTKVTVEAASDWTGILRIRVPSWTTQFQVLLNGEPAPKSTDEKGYCDVRLKESKKYQVEIRFDIPFVREGFAGGYLMRRGPEVLSIDVRDNIETILRWISFPEEMALQPSDFDGNRRRYSATLLYRSSPKEPRSFKFTPYADAGNNGAVFQTVFQLVKKNQILN